MKLILEGCAHRASRWNNDYPEVVTCLTCYARLKVTNEDGQLILAPATAPGVCAHKNKAPVSQALTRNRDYRDALCEDCGRVLRHPDGVGVWEDVMFYGYLIKEMP